MIHFCFDYINQPVSFHIKRNLYQRIDLPIQEVAKMLHETNDVSFSTLMDRIPVYVVDSDFMTDHFDDVHYYISDRKLQRKMNFVAELIDFLKELLKAIKNEEILHHEAYFYKRIKHEINHLPGHIESEEFDWKTLLILLDRILNGLYEGMNLGDTLDYMYQLEEYIRKLSKIYKEIWSKVSEVSAQPPMEYLGFYCPQWKKMLNESDYFFEKAIFICPERIRDCTASSDKYDFLLKKVLIHEFCHAYMDIKIIDKGNANHVYHWMEESMANVMTLMIIEKYIHKCAEGKEMLDYALSFMPKQPDAYAFAVPMWENGICDYDLWAWNKEKCLVAPSVQAWCKEMEAQGSSASTERMRALWNEVKNEIIKL